MLTRSAARARAASLPPPVSPSLKSQALKTSNSSTVLENADSVWSSNSLEQMDKPATQVNNPSSVEARISPSLSVEEGKESGSVSLGLGRGSHDPLAQGAVSDDGFVKPSRYAKNLKGSASHSSLSSNEQYFPAWFSSPQVGKNIKRFDWSESSSEDELPDISDLEVPIRPDVFSRELPIIEPHTSLEVELAEILGMHSSHNILQDRMRRVEVFNSGDSDSDSTSADSLKAHRHSHQNRSKYRHYKHPKRPRQAMLEVNVVDFDQADDQSGPMDLRSESRAEGPSSIPYLDKGKYKALSDTEHSEVGVNDQIHADHLIALELEQRLNAEARKSKKLAKKYRKVERKLQSMKEQATNQRMPSQMASSVRKSRTPLGAGGKLRPASSRLPEKSGLRRAMQGYGGSGNDPSSSSSSSSDSDNPHAGGRRQDRSGDSSSSSDDIFRHEPESDHSSDSEGTKHRKHEKRRRHRAKLNALKYHQSFLKNEPPFKYGGEVQASTFKKWCQEKVPDWKGI
ncbi:hypothetical protein PILCRDRAFT_13044 [Piloderma croceum F 1598]|uniref:Uncharacterized protein n=1 Tax=Piloderma croceum (strain F 1598) TaxID=765440 RepID=A0A0C3F8H9_PILCF|nr:hypothetical protein PILCRDRAFT_13044 [Piloderma croceum F 1598]